MYTEKLNFFAGKIIPASAVDGFTDCVRDLIAFDADNCNLIRDQSREACTGRRSGLLKPVNIEGVIELDISIEGLPAFHNRCVYRFEADTLDFNVITRIMAERSAIFNEIYRRGLEYSASLDQIRLKYDPNDTVDLERFHQAAADFTSELLAQLPR